MGLTHFTSPFLNVRDAFKKKVVWRTIAPTRGGGGKKRCQMSQLKMPLLGNFFWGEGVKILFPFSFLYKEVKRKLLMWVGKF